MRAGYHGEPMLILAQMGVGGGLSDAPIMPAAAVGVAQKEDDEERIDEQDIFDGVVFFLPAITLFLFNRVLGPDDAPFRAVMGKRGEAGAAAGMGATGAGSRLGNYEPLEDPAGLQY